jgi:hypothetical protein
MASSKGGRRDNPLDRLRHLHPDEIGQDALGELLHDLQVSQEELTAQNAQLIETQHALEASRDRYVDLYDFAPIGFMTINISGMVREINLTEPRCCRGSAARSSAFRSAHSSPTRTNRASPNTSESAGTLAGRVRRWSWRSKGQGRQLTFSS